MYMYKRTENGNAYNVCQIHLFFIEQLPEIHMCIKEMESCFQILMPMFEPEPEPQTNENTITKGSPFIRFDSTSNDGDFDGVESDDNEAEANNEGAESDMDDDDIHVLHEDEIKTSMNGNQSDTSDSEVEWEDVETELNTGNESEATITTAGGAHGMVGDNWNISFEIPQTLQVIKGKDNDSLVEVLKEKYGLLVGKYLRNIGKWIEVEKKYC